jgi:WD40 repeat protein
MISGRPPFQADSAVTLMMMVLNDPLPDLRKFRREVPEELLAIVYKALAREHSQRYQSMDEMAAALLEVQGNLVAPPPVPTVVDDGRAKPDQPIETPPKEIMTVEDSSPEPSQAQASPAIHPAVTSAGRDLRHQETMIPTIPLEQKIGAESSVAPAPVAKPAAKEATRFGRRGIFMAVAGALFLLVVLVAGYLYLRSQQPPNLQLTPITSASLPVNAETAQGVVSLGLWDTDSIVEDLAISPDSAFIGTANSRYWLRFAKYRFYGGVWQVATGSFQYYLHLNDQPVTAVGFSPDGQLVATASDDGSLILWQAQEGDLVQRIDTSIGGITSVDFSPNNLLLAASSWDGIVGLWQVSNGNLLRTFKAQEYAIKDADFSPDGSLLAAASDDHSVLIWRVSDGSLIQSLRHHQAAVGSVAFSPDGKLLASASDDHMLGLWQVNSGDLLYSLQGHSETVKDVAFSPDGSLLASGSEDATLRLWRVSDGQLLSTLPEEDSVLSIALSPDGSYLVAGVANNILHFWGISEAIPLETAPTPASP